MNKSSEADCLPSRRHGRTLLEIMPWDAVRDPERPGVTIDSAMRPLTGSHVLISADVQSDRVLALAHEAGWRAEPGSAGLFEFVNVWIENAYLIEIMSASQAARYRSASLVRPASPLSTQQCAPSRPHLPPAKNEAPDDPRLVLQCADALRSDVCDSGGNRGFGWLRIVVAFFLCRCAAEWRTVAPAAGCVAA
jgi:hypothetical protein